MPGLELHALCEAVYYITAWNVRLAQLIQIQICQDWCSNVILPPLVWQVLLMLAEI